MEPSMPIQQELSTRRDRVVEQLSGLRLDAALIGSAQNLRYLTGFTGSNGLVLLSGQSAVFFTDPRYEIQASKETGLKVLVRKESLWVAAAKHLVRHRWHSVGIEEQTVTCAARAVLISQSRPGVQPKGVDGVLSRMRAKKSPDEVAAIRRSVLVNSAAFSRVLDRVKVGMSERDLAAEIDYLMRLEGADGTAFETLVAAGRRSSLPHAHPTGNRLKAGQMVLVDMGACCDGYMSDMTRMFHLGPPRAKFRKLYGQVLEAQMAAVSAVRPGIESGKLDQVARRCLKRHGVEKTFVHSLGHGLGLAIHEAPRIGKKDPTVLEAGMVVTIEPGIYFEDYGGIRIEDTVLVTAAGCEVLTPTPKELLIL
jgi:Xaa-Pro aminopeptidase